MRTEEPRVIRLQDYAPPVFTIDTVFLDVDLAPPRTVVKSTLAVRRIHGEPGAPLVLDGDDLELIAIRVDGADLGPDRYQADDKTLTIHGVPDSATVEIESAFSPEKNTTLSGIYMSNGRVFSQCEPEGFRRITFFTDRPDVLARYETKITADKAAFPDLLSNGNRIDGGDLGDGRHWALWRDPFPKPSYLFALVAGRFDRLDDTFTTMSGRVIDLSLFVDPGDASRATYALDALKRSMAWDETAFGREYDLDLFMIVAVRDFNFGAMENKGLNIFNSSLLLADADAATDFDYERIEGVVAHEYFHNWTGNRITCRDWFQLCLKEGLTVYRDQAFTADQRGAAVSRIKTVRDLRSRQFAEDAGPLAHPVRPGSYAKIDNFYTATVYEKGAELVRALKNILGEADFRSGMDLYFERCDGDAATMEDFLACFADASGRNLDAFLTWYAQAGTPRVTVTTAHDTASGVLEVTMAQRTPDTPGQSGKAPVPIPVALGALTVDGSPAPLALEGENAAAAPNERTLTLTDASQTWRFTGFDAAPTLSILRGFSAPVVIEQDETVADLALRAAHDTDAFNRWEAGQALARRALLARLNGENDGEADTAWITAGAEALGRAGDDPAMAAVAIGLPDEAELAQLHAPVDTGLVRATRKAFAKETAVAWRSQLEAAADAGPQGAFSPDATSAGGRSLRNTALSYLAALGPEAAEARALGRLETADNLTDRLAALAALDASGSDAFDPTLAAFYDRWKDQPLIVDKWFAIQARSRREGGADRVEALLAHPAFDARTPNRIYAVLGAFGFANLAAFHEPSGRSYRLFLDHVLDVDTRNPAVAARLLGAFELWPRLEPTRRSAAQSALEAARERKGVSDNAIEIISRSLSAA